jgi:hypothetical protein
MPALSEYSNVYNTALVILQKKGYRLWHNRERELYYAEKDGWDFVSDSPCGLLGLIAIFECKQPREFKEYWWVEDGPDLYGHLPGEPPDYVSVIRRHSAGDAS